MNKPLFLLLLLALSVSAGMAKPPARVKVQYATLVDSTTVIHSGEKLVIALKDPAMSGLVQPLLDRFSYLLEYALEMVNGPAPYPYHNVVDHYPVGSEQPVWVALFRSGPLYVLTDNQSHVRVFLPGDAPEAAYISHYPVLRHCLAALQANSRSDLQVEVFAYRHDYPASEMELCTQPYAFTSAVFSTPAGKIPLDIAGMADFFDQGYELTAVQLDRSRGLILYGRRGAVQTINNRAVTIADLAVAYRAINRSGDNRAYVSLDKHRDPTKVAVNFGGFLENTDIGWAVLNADKRFKTITTGYDYVNSAELQDTIRQQVPSYLSVVERAFLTQEYAGKSQGWIETRFWFYPDSIKIRTDDQFEYAAVVRPRFVADAERSRTDFKSPKEFEKKKQTLLPGSIRSAIDDLNNHFEQYAGFFRDIRELEPVARLMGISSWLSQANASWLDVDALLAVRMPACVTPADENQFITHSFLTLQKDQIADETYVITNLKSFYITPDLDRSIADYFDADTALAIFLCFKNGQAPDKYKKHVPEAAQIIAQRAEHPVKELLSNLSDVQAFTNYASYILKKPLPPAYNNYIRITDSLEAAMKEYQKNIDRAGDNQVTYNYYVREYNKAVEQYNAVSKKIKNMGIAQPGNVNIGGGVDLNPEHFAVEKGLTAEDARSMIAGLKSSKGGSGGAGYDSLSARARKDIPDLTWSTKVDQGTGEVSYRQSASGVDHNAWWTMNKGSGAWSERVQLTVNLVQERSYDPVERRMKITEYKKGIFPNSITGSRVDEGTIVFNRAPLTNPPDLSGPPAWWPR